MNPTEKIEKRYTVPDYMDFGNTEKVDNPYLLFYRYLDMREEVVNPNPRKGGKIKNSKLFKNFDNRTAMQNSMKKAAAMMGTEQRLEEDLKVIAEHFETKALTVRTNWHLIVGLGSTSVSEMAMTLHFIYGVPVIPGQAVKGMARSYVITELFDSSEKKAMDDPLFAFIFGCDKAGEERPARAGHIVFFDAGMVENSNVSLVEDIMNNHHQNYYNGGELNDTENPVPVKMLALKDTCFRFRIGVRKASQMPASDVITRHFGGDSPLALAAAILEEALQWQGVGAKTAVGYGYFDKVNG